MFILVILGEKQKRKYFKANVIFSSSISVVSELVYAWCQTNLVHKNHLLVVTITFVIDSLL